jgi:hypothetical protein
MGWSFLLKQLSFLSYRGRWEQFLFPAPNPKENISNYVRLAFWSLEKTK